MEPSKGGCKRLWAWNPNRGPTTLIVHEIFRFLQNEDFRTNLDVDPPAPPSPGSELRQEITPPVHAYGYDLVLSDNSVNYERVTLDPSLNALVEKGGIQSGSLIQISLVECRFSETVLGAKFIVIRECVPVGVLSAAKPLEELRRLNEDAYNLHLRPVCCAKATYLSAYNDDAILHEYDVDHLVHAELRNVDNSNDFISPTQLLERANEFQNSINLSGVLARVKAKSRLFHYGSWSRSRSFPFRFELIVGDAQHSVRVVLWNQLYQLYYNILKPNDIVYIKGYRLKRDKHGEWEISINPKNPTGFIDIIEEDSDLYTQLPRLHYCPISFDRLSAVAPNEHFDILGLVVYCGNSTRQYMPQQNCFFEYRWLKLATEHFQNLVAVKVYTNSRQFDFERLECGEILLLSHAQVQRLEGEGASAASAEPSFCVTTTLFSDIIHSLDPTDFDNVEDVMSVLNWADRASVKELQSLPSTYRWMIDARQCPQLSPERVTPFGRVTTLMEQLHIHQTISVIIQAKIADITFFDSNLSAEQAGVADADSYGSAVCGVLRLSALNAPIGATIATTTSSSSSSSITVVLLQSPLPHTRLTPELPIQDHTHQGMFALSLVLSDSVMRARTWGKLVSRCSSDSSSSRRSQSAFSALLSQKLCHMPLVMSLRLYRHSYHTLHSIVTGIFSA